MMGTTSDVVIVGGGLAGAAAAWRLADEGHQVTVLERTTPGNAEGSSHGSARIVRFSYPEPRYVELMVRAQVGWDELQRASGTKLLTQAGAVDHGTVRQPELLARVLDEVGVEHELLSAAEAEARWPQFRFDSQVLWHPSASVLDSQSAVEAMLGLAQATGRAQVRTDWEVAEVGRRDGGVVVASTTGEEIVAERIVVAAGGWMPYLAERLGLSSRALGLLPRFEVRQEQAFHMPYREGFGSGGARHDADNAPKAPWPTFIHKEAGLQTFGLPGGRDADYRGQKLAQFNGGPRIPSAREQTGQVDPATREWMIDYAKRYLPGLVPEPYAETTCLFTNTPTEDFLVDDVEGVILVSACSGHGAKFAPLLGEIVADLIAGHTQAPDVFRLEHHARAAGHVSDAS